MKISIITASYNYAQYIEEAINSVINQSYQDWELIIVDDGSSDNSVEIIKSYCEKDNRIKLFQHENGQNRGLKETILLGLEHATGEWVAFLESDDFFAPDNLIKKIEIIKKYPNVKLIFNKVNFLWEKEINKFQQKIFFKTQKSLSKKIFLRNMFYDFFIDNKIFTFSCVMIEINALKNANFNSPLDALLDWWLWIHLAFNNEFYYINEELTNWRLHSNSYIKDSKKPKFKLIQLMAYWDVYKREKQKKIIIFMLFYCLKLFAVKTYRFFVLKFLNPILKIINKFVNKRS